MTTFASRVLISGVRDDALTLGQPYTVGITTITWTAIDECGNLNQCNQTITVTDGENPFASCQDITVQLDASGNASITGADVDGGSTDNCGIASLNVSLAVLLTLIVKL